MRDAWRHFAAEFIGTFALVFVGSGAIMTARMSQSQAGLIEVALAHGLILGVMVSADAHLGTFQSGRDAGNSRHQTD